MVNIDPTEKRDQHCKVYLEKSLKREVDRYAMLHGYSFSEAGRKLLLEALEVRGL
jgi:hypothetical protein